MTRLVPPIRRNGRARQFAGVHMCGALTKTISGPQKGDPDCTFLSLSYRIVAVFYIASSLLSGLIATLTAPVPPQNHLLLEIALKSNSWSLCAQEGSSL